MLALLKTLYVLGLSLGLYDCVHTHWLILSPLVTSAVSFHFHPQRCKCMRKLFWHHRSPILKRPPMYQDFVSTLNNAGCSVSFRAKSIVHQIGRWNTLAVLP